MKLAEALVLRADAQKRLAQLKQRLMMSARHQEGEQPPEDPAELIAEAERLMDQLVALIRGINRTNLATAFDDETLTDALARRDVLSIRRALFADLATAASVRQDRYSRSEVKFVSAVDVRELQQRADLLAKEYRDLDARIQAKNWETDLLEEPEGSR
jgi:hypothetical protein